MSVVIEETTVQQTEQPAPASVPVVPVAPENSGPIPTVAGFNEFSAALAKSTVAWKEKLRPADIRCLYADGLLTGFSVAEYLQAVADFSTFAALKKDWTKEHTANLAKVVKQLKSLASQEVKQEYAAEPVLTDEEKKAKCADAIGKFQVSARAFGRGAAKLILAIGKHGTEYVRVRLNGENDAGIRKTVRAAALRRLQTELDEACGNGSTPNLNEALRYWGVAETFGIPGAYRLSSGILKLFQTSVQRVKASERWEASVPADQFEKLQALFISAGGSASVTVADCDIAIRKIKGLALPERKQPASVEASTVEGTGTPGNGSKSVSVSVQKSDKQLPEASPESPVECAKRIASLLYGRPDIAIVLRTLGQIHRWDAEQAQALINGMVESGSLQAVAAAVQAGISAAQKVARKVA